MQITFDRKTVNECLRQKFSLPTFQRDYKWELKHLTDLLTDIQESFAASWKNTDSRTEVLGYPVYFLGTIITTDAGHGAKAIIDGQQRVTTLLLLMSYLDRVASKNPALGMSPVEEAIRRRIAGTSQFNLEMDVNRRQLFDILLNHTLNDEELTEAVESILNIDPGTKRLWELYQGVPSMISDTISSNNLIPHLADFITERVCLFEIGVPKEQDGHRVFVTMNDRGLKLTPIDLLKGFLLSGISVDYENKQAHAAWIGVIRVLQEIGSDEDSNFFKTWLRARFAKTIRGKNRGDAPADFEIIGDSYHRWVMDNKSSLCLKNGDDYYRLMTREIPFYAEIYQRIKKYEESYDHEYRHVFYNGARSLTLQTMAILSAIKPSDIEDDVKRKIKCISYVLDHLATARACQGKENTYDNVRDIIFDLSLEMRDLDSSALSALIDAKIATGDYVVNLKLVNFDQTKKQDLLHLMARLADSLERGIGITGAVGFSAYADRTVGSRTFDVEHLLPIPMAETAAEIIAAGGTPFASTSDYQTRRSMIGGLILLPRGKNRSLKSMKYTEKLTRYASENVLSQSLTKSFYLNNPNIIRYISTSGVPLTAHDYVDPLIIDARTNMYQAVAADLWSSRTLKSVMV
ncbi:DUF262 domain-containing protein [Xanthomonas campestris pv. raphani]|uniref:DUF262 domain-containing protein n=1 Tax=Xanthomonas campestris TaxID=339 RepID=UPI0023E9F899|nr:DUF262 domain-containing protein [Xanthomonas campestris]MCW2038202.1 uncharacterized protein with ParB-like and HNH nuclease domain [Xanthomonas campestris]MEA9827419.1 DUF262 domain-containing protein [Xanthomonas campestris pv. raphani]